jgi:hypothetical protein
MIELGPHICLNWHIDRLSSNKSFLKQTNKTSAQAQYQTPPASDRHHYWWQTKNQINPDHFRRTNFSQTQKLLMLYLYQFRPQSFTNLNKDDQQLAASTKVRLDGNQSETHSTFLPCGNTFKWQQLPISPQINPSRTQSFTAKIDCWWDWYIWKESIEASALGINLACLHNRRAKNLRTLLYGSRTLGGAVAWLVLQFSR